MGFASMCDVCGFYFLDIRMEDYKRIKQNDELCNAKKDRSFTEQVFVFEIQRLRGFQSIVFISGFVPQPKNDGLKRDENNAICAIKKKERKVEHKISSEGNLRQIWPQFENLLKDLQALPPKDISDLSTMLISELYKRSAK